MKGKRLSGWVLAGVFLGALGCKGSVSELSGTVRVKGEPLPSGTLTFTGADGKKAYSALGSDGRYSVRGLAEGQAKVSVVSHPRVPAGFGGGGEKHVEIPARYARP